MIVPTPRWQQGSHSLKSPQHCYDAQFIVVYVVNELLKEIYYKETRFLL